MPEEADSAFDAVTRFMVEELMVDVRDLRKRVDGLLWLAARVSVRVAVSGRMVILRSGSRASRLVDEIASLGSFSSASAALEIDSLRITSRA